MLVLIAYFVGFMSLGLWVGLRLNRFKLFLPEFLYLTSFAASLVVFYALFYLYLISPELGRAVLAVVMIGSFVMLWDLLKTLRGSREKLRLVATFYLPPLLIIGVVFVIFTSILYGCRLPVSDSADKRRPINESFCTITNMPLDNGLPMLFADFTIANQERNLVLDWTIADRPPLQIATSLPILDLAKGEALTRLAHYYNLFSIFLQLSWIAAVWGVFRLLRLRPRVQLLLFIGFCCTGFFFLNSIFVWPKLLAAALVLAGLAPFIGQKLSNKHLRYLPVSATLIGLGMLSHTSVIFTLIPAGVIIAYKLVKEIGLKLNYRLLSIAVLIGLALLLPWQVYKGTVASSDRLVKYHFADVTSYEDKRGTLETIVDEYKKLSFGQWLSNKSQNVQTLFVAGWKIDPGCQLTFSAPALKSCLDWRNVTFFSTFFALEIFTIGAVVLAYQAFKRRLDSFDKESLLIVGGGLLVWALLMFHPGGTVVHQGSYATMVLLFIVLGRALARLPLKVLAGLTGIQVGIFLIIWVLGPVLW